MSEGISVAIDGPAGAGKSTVSKALAARTGFQLLDTGAMYRAYAWAWLQDKAQNEAVSIADSAGNHVVKVMYIDGRTAVTCDGQDISEAIRLADVTAAVSEVSAVPDVRERAVAMQQAAVVRELESGRGVILEGRDIGTTVLPQATLKFFLTADPRARAERRALEIGADTETIVESIMARDAADTTRAASPLRKADDAVEIDATHLSADQVVDLMYQRIRDVREI